MIASHQSDRKRKQENGEGPASKKGARIAATEAAAVAAAGGHTATSSRRPVVPVERMNLREGRSRDYDAERATTKRNRQSKDEFQHLMKEVGNLRSAIGDELERDIISESGKFMKEQQDATLEEAQEQLEAATSYSSLVAASFGG